MAVPSWSTRQWVEKGREKTCQSDQREREVSERSFFSLISHTLTAHTPSLLTVPAVSSARHHFLAHDRLRDSEAKGALARRGKRRERADRSPLSYLPRPERNGMGGRGPNSFSLPCLLTAIPHSTLHLHAIASGSEGLARDGKSEGDGCVVSPYPSLWLTYRHTPIHSYSFFPSPFVYLGEGAGWVIYRWDVRWRRLSPTHPSISYSLSLPILPCLS